MSTPPSLGDILNSILGAVTTVISAVAQAIADNAEVIGTVAIMGVLLVSVMGFGSKVFRNIGTWFKGVL